MECKHEYEEDEMFKSGCVKMICGTISDLNKETRMVCKLCGHVEYKVIKDENNG